MLTAQAIHFSYGKNQFIRDLSLTVRDGECLVLTGPNGSGKSTVLSLLADVLKPQKGEIQRQGDLALIPQGNGLFEDMSVEDNLLFFAGLKKVPLPEPLPFSLDKHRKKRLSDLSGGEQKRVSISCALLGNPQNLLFDEPCAGLDLNFQQELNLLMQYLKSQGRALVYTAHDPAEYVRFADHILFLGGESPRLFAITDFFSRQLDYGEAAENIADYYRSLSPDAQTKKEENNE